MSLIPIRIRILFCSWIIRSNQNQFWRWTSISSILGVVLLNIILNQWMNCVVLAFRAFQKKVWHWEIYKNGLKNWLFNFWILNKKKGNKWNTILVTTHSWNWRLLKWSIKSFYFFLVLDLGVLQSYGTWKFG